MQIPQRGESGFPKCFTSSLQHLPQAQSTQAIWSNLLARDIRLLRGVFSLPSSRTKNLWVQFWSKNGSKAPRFDECALKASVNSVLLFSCKNYFICCVQSPFIGFQYFGGWMEGRKPGACRGEGTAEHCAQHILQQSLDFFSASSLQADVCVGVWACGFQSSTHSLLAHKTAWKVLLVLHWPQKALHTHILPGGLPSHL